MKNNQSWVVAGLLAVAFIWGSGFIATQVAIDEGLSSTFIMAVRFTVAAVVMGVTGRREIKRMTKKQVGQGGLVGIFLFVAFLLQTIGLEHTTPSMNAFMTATCVVMVPFFSWVWFKHKPSTKTFVATILCFCGIALLAFADGGQWTISLGAGITFLGAIAFALHTISLGAFTADMPPRLLTFLQISVAAVLSLITFWLVDGDLSSFQSKKGILAVLYLALFSTCIAYFIQTVCQKYATPSTAAIIISTESLFGTGLSIFLGFEPFSYLLAVGGALVFLSILLVETTLFDRLWSR